MGDRVYVNKGQAGVIRFSGRASFREGYVILGGGGLFVGADVSTVLGAMNLEGDGSPTQWRGRSVPQSPRLPPHPQSFPLQNARGAVADRRRRIRTD